MLRKQGLKTTETRSAEYPTCRCYNVAEQHSLYLTSLRTVERWKNSFSGVGEEWGLGNLTSLSILGCVPSNRPLRFWRGGNCWPPNRPRFAVYWARKHSLGLEV